MIRLFMFFACFLPALSLFAQQCKGSFFLNNTYDIQGTAFDKNTGGTYIGAYDGTNSNYSKYDTNGNHVWDYTITGFNAALIDISSDSEGNLILTGQHSGITIADNPLPRYNGDYSGAVDAFLVKVDKDGNSVWSKNLIGKGSQFGQLTYVDKDDNVYFGGVVNNFIEIEGNKVYTPDISFYRDLPYIVLIKYDRDGKYLWHYMSMDFNDITLIRNLNVDSEGNIYMLDGSRELYKFKSDGTLQFRRKVLGSEGNFTINAKDELIFDCTVWENSVYKYSHLLKLNKDGDIISRIDLGNIHASYLIDLKTDGLDNIYIAGGVIQPFTIGNTVVCNPGYYLLKMNPDGKIEWVVNPPGNQNNWFRSILINGSDVRVAGYFYNTEQFPLLGNTKNFVNEEVDRGGFISTFGTEAYKPIVNKSKEYLMCPRESVTFTTELLGDAYSYNWMGGIVRFNDQDNSISLNLDQDSLEVYRPFYLLLTDSLQNCAYRSDDIQLKPRIEATTQQLCDEDKALLQIISGPSEFYWTKDGVRIQSGTEPTLEVSEEGDYNAVFVDVNTECEVISNTVSIYKSTIGNPILSKEKDSYCEGEIALISWNNADGTILSNWYIDNKIVLTGPIQSINATLAGSYFVKAEDVYGCSAVSNVVAVAFQDLPVVKLEYVNNKLVATNGYTYQWYLNDQLIEGVTNNEYFPEESGTYKVLASNQFNCSEFTNAVEVVVTDIVDAENQKAKTIYPNPTNGLLHIGFENVERVLITDLTGKIMMSRLLNNAEIDLSGFNNGVYLIKVYYRYSTKYTIDKIILNR